MKTYCCPYAVLVCCAVALTIGAWLPANAHDGEAHTQGAVADGPEQTTGPPAASQSQQRPVRRLLAHKPSQQLPNILLRTQGNTPVRLYDDLVKDRTIMINFMYTTCYDICPGTTGNLMRVHQQLGDRVGRDILMLSISIDPAVDTPDTLQKYAARYGGNQPGWLFLTGEADDITLLRRILGLYDPDPVIDADKTQHTGLITFGNDRTGRWAALPALMPSEELARTILRITREQNPGFPSRLPR
jgi:protein SCO1